MIEQNVCHTRQRRTFNIQKAVFLNIFSQYFHIQVNVAIYLPYVS